MKRILDCGAAGSAPPRLDASLRQAPAKKDLVQKLLQLQQPGIEQLARGLVERPAARMMQEAGVVLQTQVPPEKREAIGKAIEADVKKYVDDATPLVRDRAIKLAPSTIGAMLEEKFTEDELKQIIAWFESPVNKKYQQVGAEMQQRLRAEAGRRCAPGGRSEAAGARRTASAPTLGAAARAAGRPRRARSRRLRRRPSAEVTSAGVADSARPARTRAARAARADRRGRPRAAGAAEPPRRAGAARSAS